MGEARYAWVTAVLFLCAIVVTPVRAEVITTGNTYDAWSYFYAGYSDNSTGTLTVDAGSLFSRSYGYLGYATGSTGSAVITGAGSKWINSGSLYVGYSGSGRLTVSDGGEVSAKMLYASLNDLHGDGTITVQSGGIVDADLSFGAAHGLTQSLAFGSGGTIEFTVDGVSELGVGYKQSGSLRIAEGCSVASTNGYLGYYSGSAGVATITGVGSQWTNVYGLTVGRSGSGTLRVEAGGQVSSPWGTVGYRSGSVGEAIITGAGSMWTNAGSLYVGDSGNGTLKVADGGLVSTGTLGASLTDLYGDGTISAQSGVVLDTDLSFDAVHGLTQTMAFGTGGTLQFTVSSMGSLGAGYKQSGSLRIADGRSVASTNGYLGYHAGSTGDAIITGAGSKWGNSSLYVGYNGSGTLRVEAGGRVTSYSGYLGYLSGSTGSAIITGAGSKWTNSGDLFVGRNGSGKLTVSDGGVVSAQTLYASLGDLYGDGTITVQSGGVLDADLVFDTTHGAAQSLSFGSGGTLQFTVGETSILGVGHRSTGSLRIAEGRAVTSRTGYLGYQSGSTGVATVTGAGSKWTNTSLYVGWNGSGTLQVEAGGQVSSKGGTLGDGLGSAGTVIITGAGSKWTSSGTLHVGSHGDGTLRVEAGGQVSNTYSGSLGVWAGSTGEAIISGAGSKWTNSGDLYVGQDGSGTLRLEAGGQVSNYSGYLGEHSGSTGEAIVTGAGSKWTNFNELWVGEYGSGSGKLTVSDGGVVSAKTLYASMGDLYGNGTITVQSDAYLDGDLIADATVSAAQAVAFGSGGTLQLPSDGTGALAVGYRRSGSLRIAVGRSVASSVGYLGYSDGSTGTAIITGVASKWTNSGNLHVGYYSSGTLRVEAGGQVSNATGYLGYGPASTGEAIISGAGSTWTDSGDLYVGYKGSSTLRVETGGQVSDTTGYLGYYSGSAGEATITGVGSRWSNSGGLIVGYSGRGTLRVQAGGQVSGSGALASQSGSTGTAIISGSGSLWTSPGGLYVGRSGSGTLRVEAGGQVSNINGYMGYNSGSTGEAIITGDGSKWVNSGDLYVGYYGSGTLTVSDGGVVSAQTLYASMGDLYGNGTISTRGVVLDADLAYDASHDLTQTLAFGSGGTLSVSVNGTGDLGVGYERSGSLHITEGRSVRSADGFLGHRSGSTGTAIISGTGSKWTNSGELHVGYDGSGSLRVEAGGQVSNSTGYLGDWSGSTGEAIITGAGSMWINSYGLRVGQYGSSTLRVEAGGRVSNTNGNLGLFSGSTGTAVITGSGSNWSNSGYLRVGESGNGTLRVEDGGQVSNTDGYLGLSTGSTGTAVITGAGSKWTNSGSLYVGCNGSGKLTVSDGGVVSAKTLYASLGDLYGNGTISTRGVVLDADLSFDASHGLMQTLTFGSGGTLQFSIDRSGDLGVGHKESGSLRIAEGRSVASTNGYLGFNSGSTGSAVISGAGSTWTNAGYLDVGISGSGTLRVEAGGRVSNTDGCLGYNSGSTGEAIITGAGSKWTNSGYLYVGNRPLSGGTSSTGSGKLTVSDGGQVTAMGLYINSQSIVRLHVSGERMLVLGNWPIDGSITNAGRLAFLADAFLPSGTYRPIGEYANRKMSWSGSGSTLAVGGIWDDKTKTFTVIDPTLVDACSAASAASGTRLLISDSKNRERVGVSLGELSSGGELTGWALTQEERAGLLAGLGEGEKIVGAWEFEGQLAGGEVLVSMEAGVGAEEVRVWRLVEGQWSEYRPEMLTYDGKGVVSFTVEAGSLCAGAYAVSVPEPGAVSLLVMGVGMMVGGRHGRRRGRA